MRIAVFGLGYVGSVTGACLAKVGHRVVGVDPNPAKVDLINRGMPPVIERDLPEIMKETVAAGRFRATGDHQAALAASDLALVCVGTPSRPNGSIDLTHVSKVAQQIGAGIRKKKGFFTVGIRSTVLPGSVEEVVIPILEKHSRKKAGTGFGVCMVPEFLREGSSVKDFFDPPKTIIGELNPRSGAKVAALFKFLDAPLVRTRLRVAEMAKYADNSFHALKIVFANEVGNICKEMGIDSHQVMDIFCLDRKLNLSPTYLKPGFAFGGSCLPKDLRALTHEARIRDVDTPLLSSLLESNRQQVLRVAHQLMEHKGKTLGFMGLSFKGGTDDLRESPLVELIEIMLGKGFSIRIYDKHVSLARLVGSNKEYIEKGIPHISSLLCASPGELLGSSDVIVVGHAAPEIVSALRAGTKPRHVLYDLVRFIPEGGKLSPHYHGICW